LVRFAQSIAITAHIGTGRQQPEKEEFSMLGTGAGLLPLFG
jgi:hypothetical protein